jgi:hypothetical protein
LWYACVFFFQRCFHLCGSSYNQASSSICVFEPAFEKQPMYVLNSMFLVENVGKAFK